MGQVFHQPRWILSVVLFVTLTIAACGGGDEDDTTGTDPGSASTTTSSASASASPHTGMQHSTGGSPMSNADMDLAFIDGMIVHHQSAIDMAEIALEQAEHEEVRLLAEEIIAAQQREIDQMREWRDVWFPGAAVSAGMPGMSDMAGMDMSESEMQALRDAEPFDMAFIDEMVPHHQSATMMAEEILETSDRPEIVQLAEEIISAQQTEIEQMQEWRSAWFGD